MKQSREAESVSDAKKRRVMHTTLKNGKWRRTNWERIHKEIAGKNFSHYIVQSQRQLGVEIIAKAKFFSLLMDGSTDKAGVDNEVFMAVWCDINTFSSDEKIHTQTTYFHVGM
jgi:hypothetical protein